MKLQYQIKHKEYCFQRTLFILIVSMCLLICAGLCAQQVRGVWVECEGSNDTLSSPTKLQQLISLAKDSGINTIFLQVSRHNRSWYNSSLSDTTPFNNIWAKHKIDPLEYTIHHAHRNNIKVYAWINIFRIGKQIDAPVIKKLSNSVITCDGSGKTLIKYPASKLPDGGYWLDPGDLKVQNYILDIVSELIQKYPQLDGIHLDYIRYPYLELNPGSRFSDRKDFGYGTESVKRFKAKFNYSPLNMNLDDKIRTQKWDDWRRQQITDLIGKIYKLCKNKKKDLKVSCAVQPWIDRAYLVAYQDWCTWLSEGIVDFVVIMNYSIDRKIVKYLSEAAIKTANESSVYVGLGAYLLLNLQNSLYLQIKDCQELKARGIVLFSYDALLKNKNILKIIAKNKWWQ